MDNNISLMEGMKFGILSIIGVLIVAIPCFEYGIVGMFLPLMKTQVFNFLDLATATSIAANYDFIITATRICFYGLIFVAVIYMIVLALRTETDTNVAQ